MSAMQAFVSRHGSEVTGVLERLVASSFAMSLFFGWGRGRPICPGQSAGMFPSE
jgi:hypothetical protein